MRPMGTKQDPLRRGTDGERPYKYCLCYKCGTIAKCVPQFDFYTHGDEDRLICEKCMHAGIKGNGQ